MQTTISILGCGWLGIQLGQKLIERNYRVKGSTGTPARVYEIAAAGIEPYFLQIEPNLKYKGSPHFFDTDVLIVLLPPKRVVNIEHMFPAQIYEIIKLLKQFGTLRVLFVSSTSVYQASNRLVKEGEEGIPASPSGRALLNAEKMLFLEKDFQTTVIRCGGLMGPGRNPAFFFKGRKDIPGDIPVNLIHSDDCVNIFISIIEKNIWGEVFNACCPVHPSRKEFYSMAASVNNLPIPVFSEGIENYKIVDSSKLQKKLEYSFIYNNPIDYLKELKSTS